MNYIDLNFFRYGTFTLILFRLDLEEQRARLEADLQQLHEREDDPSSPLVLENQALTNRLEGYILYIRSPPPPMAGLSNLPVVVVFFV